MGFSPFLPLTQPAMCHKPRDYGSTPWFKLGRKSYLQEPTRHFYGFPGFFSKKSECFWKWYSEMVLWTVCFAQNPPIRHVRWRLRKVCVFNVFCHGITTPLYIKCHPTWVAKDKAPTIVSQPVIWTSGKKREKKSPGDYPREDSLSCLITHREGVRNRFQENCKI